jgi:hypothetical protein
MITIQKLNRPSMQRQTEGKQESQKVEYGEVIRVVVRGLV